MPSISLVSQPQTLFQRFAFWQSRRQYGRVLTPLRVIYARKPKLAFIAQFIASTMERGMLLDSDLVLLVRVHVARLNGCAFCQDLTLAQAIQEEMGLDRFRALLDYETSPLFSDRERAALAFCEEANRDRHVEPSTFARLRDHFDEVEVVELAWLHAAESYFNLQAAVLGIGSDGLAEPDSTSEVLPSIAEMSVQV